jgi:hypothetical protein
MSRAQAETAMANEMVRRFPLNTVDAAKATQFLKARQWDMSKATQLLHDNLAW